ncbi:Haloacid dehalogenase (HAD) superfamily hydrolase [Corynebacterium kutscheri]|uniref:Haloacid dehalogenase (HAD) superfamily hydrolase n=1 Tax=Corynebacterium kutscheri TaxID=35755 RepID=A0A0F6R1N5_9CORY|nr:HAD-IIA family hydrolase [Corynebacterium kutscheri]AKE41148.1 putative sugar phosphatase of HAD superfamily [Corynebacterium kutscheri]VEH07057.1 Haloacid dehalogenase (HAD) superfamily hydrolase [Corynebacterium kutscheri]VEH09468.1 Haloacid dehalogenase (HAD) superfamily hydrolase [Corynebacterium kutscheri]VEH79553.1 Haloacid dehalogenase (HAD) superfamily hydrolase [Corynebacterium kutscheri]
MSLLDIYDALLFDLDGTVWEGGRPLPDAPEVINASPVPVVYITNNASRGPVAVAELLNGMNITTTSDQILTSAMAAVELVTDQFPVGSPVYVLGSDSFKELVTQAGLKVVVSADENPVAVIHGHNPDTGWAQLSEAALAIRRGAKYFASNLDTTLPSERGLLVGNGSMVAALVSATGVTPISAGKPEPAMFYSAQRKLSAIKPLAIGDRLNTDIAGGVAAGMDSLHVLTGVSLHWALLRAIPEERPTYVADGLIDLHRTPEELLPGPQGSFTALFDGDTLVLSGGNNTSTATEALRSAIACAWTKPEAFNGEVRAEGQHAQRAVGQWQ